MNGDQNLPVRRFRRQVRDKRVRRFKADLLRVSPQLDDPKFRPVVESFARLSLLALDGYEFLRAKGLVGDSGEIRASVSVVRQLMDSQFKMATALGIVPGAQAGEVIDMTGVGNRIQKVLAQQDEYRKEFKRNGH